MKMLKNKRKNAGSKTGPKLAQRAQDGMNSHPGHTSLKDQMGGNIFDINKLKTHS